tara:strand:- start:589 stop:744 length:156 start_codon:yes stop_codon:yes gene_type:complete
MKDMANKNRSDLLNIVMVIFKHCDKNIKNWFLTPGFNFPELIQKHLGAFYF